MPVSTCPTIFPSSLTSAVQSFAAAWSTSPTRPRPSLTIALAWQALLNNRINTPDLPLFIRKHDGNRGRELIHQTGRILVPVDNSAVHWAYTLAVTGNVPSIQAIHESLVTDKIPVFLTRAASERFSAKYHCALTSTYATNAQGWKLAHIKAIGLKVKTPLEQISISTLHDHFLRFLYPMNIFLIPKEWAGVRLARTLALSFFNFLLKKTNDEDK